MHDFLLTFTVCLALAFVISEVFHRFRYPRILGQIIAGIVLGLPILHDLVFTPDTLTYISFLSQLGIIFLLLLAGLEIDYRRLMEVSREAVLVAVFSAAIPFAMGFLLMKLFGYSDVLALIVGGCLAVTAEATKVKVLMDFKVLDTKLGAIMLAAGAIDDILEIILLSMVLVLVQTEGALGLSQLITLPLEILLFIALVYLFFKSFPWIARYMQRTSELGAFSISIILGLCVVMLSEFLGLGPVIGALVAGLILRVSIRAKEERKIAKDLRIAAFGLIVPFFFIWIGMQFDVNALFMYPVLVLLITLIATLGKLSGSIIVKFFSKLSLKQTALIGWGMNSRGAVELVIASAAYPVFVRENAVEIFSAVVIMAIITTMIFPVMLKHELKKNPLVMDD
ncbi:MAG: hypothetical protein A7316_05260 [Candidatus Altiarchaeales archaeon WOR_SM1_86-2]|nr:MAG: hypothetical protein A7316_05260 [Candidatus Altiarchaeales archaeon WOR_SM1_86-2]